MSKRIAIAILTSCFLVACGGGNEANTSKDTPVSDTSNQQPVNSGNTDSGNTDSGNTDSGNTNSGNTNSGNTDSGNTDSGNTDSGNTDSDNTDSDNTDSDNTDSGNTDSGNTDSDNTDSDNTDSGNEQPDDGTDEAPNNDPIVEVVAPADASFGETISLKATASDEDGDTLTYEWQQLAGQPVSLEGEDIVSITLPDPINGYDEIYSFALTVTDEHGAQAKTAFELSVKQTLDTRQAARLLHQAGIGPTYTEILAAEGKSAEQWVDEQMQLPITYHVDYLENYPNRDYPIQINRIDAWWKSSINAPDQLRQRVAYAMSQIFVVSDYNNALANQPKGMVSYYDMLQTHAFGNFRDLLESITLSPIMGIYLDHLNNEKADEERNIRPDENYARELLQLFSLGLNELDLNGTAKKDENGLPIPAYSQEHIEGFAKVFTGWTYGASEFWNRPSNNHSIPMSPFEEYHSSAEKHLLNGVVIPENTGPEESLKIALDTIFEHPNVAPFISKQLILKLITSNPSPSYVERVAKVFNDNGEGVKGDLAAVVKAIYLDAEARQFGAPLEYFGKVKEPLLKQAHVWRVFDAKALNNFYFTGNLPLMFGQGPLQSTSVFNFYQPDHQPQELSGSELLAPELQIANDAYVINTLNSHFDEFSSRVAERYDSLYENRVYLYMAEDMQLLANFGLNAVLDKYDILFFAGAMSEEMRQAIYDMDAYFSSSESHLRLAYIIFLITVSAEYSLQQ